MEGKRYVVKGEVRFRGKAFPFQKEVEGKSERHALHKLYSLFGSHNGVKRTAIKVEEIKEVEGNAG